MRLIHQTFGQMDESYFRRYSPSWDRASWRRALVESFPSELQNVRQGFPINRKIPRRLVRILRDDAHSRKYTFLPVGLVNYLGEVVGDCGLRQIYPDTAFTG